MQEPKLANTKREGEAKMKNKITYGQMIEMGIIIALLGVVLLAVNLINIVGQFLFTFGGLTAIWFTLASVGQSKT